MTYQEMVDVLALRLGGAQTFERLFSQQGEIDTAFNVAQSQVSDAMIARFGYAAVPDMDHELADPDITTTEYIYAQNVPVATGILTMSDGAASNLPECYHMAIVYGAALLLANKMGDNMPTLTSPGKMFAEYTQALNRGHKVYALTLYSQTPDRILDGYNPWRHLDEEL